MFFLSFSIFVLFCCRGDSVILSCVFILCCISLMEGRRSHGCWWFLCWLIVPVDMSAFVIGGGRFDESLWELAGRINRCTLVPSCIPAYTRRWDRGVLSLMIFFLIVYVCLVLVFPVVLVDFAVFGVFFVIFLW